jgi:hypothetical protein
VHEAAGAPVPGVKVSQFWNHYSLEPGESHHEQRVTAADGSVEFAARTIRGSLGWRFIRCVKNFSENIDASCGPDASATVEVRDDPRPEFYESLYVRPPATYVGRIAVTRCVVGERRCR